MTAADPSLRRLSYPLKPRPFSEPSDFYLLPLSAISTSGTGSEELAQKSQAGKIDKDTWYAVLKKLPPEKIEDLAKKWGISLE